MVEVIKFTAGKESANERCLFFKPSSFWSINFLNFMSGFAFQEEKCIYFIVVLLHQAFNNRITPYKTFVRSLIKCSFVSLSWFFLFADRPSLRVWCWDEAGGEQRRFSGIVSFSWRLPLGELHIWGRGGKLNKVHRPELVERVPVRSNETGNTNTNNTSSIHLVNQQILHHYLIFKHYECVNIQLWCLYYVVMIVFCISLINVVYLWRSSYVRLLNMISFIYLSSLLL